MLHFCCIHTIDDYLSSLMVLHYIFISAIVIQCAYGLFFFIRVFALFKGQHTAHTGVQGVSVIICAKNEAANLRKNLPAVLSQKYSVDFEVVVVDDASADDTADVLKELAQQYSNLRQVSIIPGEERTLKGKKFALSRGVAAAKYEWLLLTDADCTPESNEWLEQMVTPLCHEKEIVLGYSGYSKHTTLLNAFIRWETLHTFLQYSTYSLAGMPYMAVGRNTACTKGTLEKAQQDPLWNALPSGDDDLMVRVAGNAHNTAVVCYKESFTYSEAKGTWKEWVAQKQRHLSTGKYYKTHIKILQAVYGITHAIAWIGYFALLFYDWKTSFFFMGIRCKGYWLIWSATAGKLREKSLIFLFPLFDLGWMIYNFAFLPYIVFKNKKSWK